MLRSQGLRAKEHALPRRGGSGALKGRSEGKSAFLASADPKAAHAARFKEQFGHDPPIIASLKGISDACVFWKVAVFLDLLNVHFETPLAIASIQISNDIALFLAPRKSELLSVEPHDAAVGIDGQWSVRLSLS